MKLKSIRNGGVVEAGDELAHRLLAGSEWEDVSKSKPTKRTRSPKKSAKAAEEKPVATKEAAEEK